MSIQPAGGAWPGLGLPDPGDEGRHSVRRWVPCFAGDCSENNALPVTVGGGDSF